MGQPIIHNHAPNQLDPFGLRMRPTVKFHQMEDFWASLINPTLIPTSYSCSKQFHLKHLTTYKPFPCETARIFFTFLITENVSPAKFWTQLRYPLEMLMILKLRSLGDTVSHLLNDCTSGCSACYFQFKSSEKNDTL